MSDYSDKYQYDDDWDIPEVREVYEDFEPDIPEPPDLPDDEAPPENPKVTDSRLRLTQEDLNATLEDYYKEEAKAITGQTSKHSTKVVAKELPHETNPVINVINQLLDSKDLEIFRDEHEIVYARIREKQGKRIVQVDSEKFRVWLRAHIGYLEGKHPRDIILYLDQVKFLASNSNPHKLSIRVSPDPQDAECLWIDLDGHKAVFVSPEGWEINENPPILFATFNNQRSLHTPVKYCHPKKLLEYLNITDTEVAHLFMAYIISGFVPVIQLPALVLHGPPGSAKSTLLTVLKRVLDPGKPELINNIRNIDNLVQTASQNRVINLDNLTNLSDELSNTICSYITGHGYGKRKLYTDEDTIVREFKNIVGISGIRLVPDKSDLLDRSLILRLDKIKDENRQSEVELLGEFEKELPQIFHGILDCLVETLNGLDKIQIQCPSRMIDFGRYGCAAISALGMNVKIFERALLNNRVIHTESAIEASHFGTVLLEFLESVGGWKGNTTKLEKDLRKYAHDEKIKINQLQWPDNHKAIASELEYLRIPLEESGFGYRKIPGGRLKEFIRITEN